MDNVMHMTYASSLSPLCEVNSSFDTGVLRIAYTGKNRNGSSISKDVFEKCIQTMYNCPIVCNYDRESDSIGGHDMELVTSSSGDMRLVNCTTPVGVIPESSNYFWETVEEDDGEVHEYLCADALIWKRQEAYQKIKNNGTTGHSMEITVKNGELNDGVFTINDFEFTAFCLLGDDHEPCFESSSIGLFTLDSFKDQMKEMMSDLKNTYSIISPCDNVAEDNNIPTEGGEKVLNDKIALAAEYNIDVETLDFSIEEMTIEELKEKFEAMSQSTAPVVSEPEVAFELNGQLCDEIRIAMEAEVVERPWGKMPRYSVVEFDVEAMMVYCYDTEDHWRLYGFSFSKNGDTVNVDFESKKRVKFAIVDFDGGEQENPLANAFEKVAEQYVTNDTEWSEKYQAASDTIETMNTELDSLRQFKAAAEDAAAEAARNEIFAQFEDLAGVEEFEALHENCGELSMESLTEKCYAIRGRMSTTAKFTKKPETPRLMVDRGEPEDEAYGGLFSKYKPTI